LNNEKDFKDLPEGWKWVRLGEVIENTYPGEWGDNPIDNENIFPVFSTLAIDYDGRIDFTKAVPRKLNKKKIEKLKLKKGMILIEKSGGSTDTPAGKVAILKQDFEGSCSNFIQILKPNNNTCNSYYLFYRLLYNFKNNLIEKYQQRTTGIINFILKDYFNEYIPLPPLPEQQKIAEILETIDNAIEKTDKIIEKYKRIKQGLMQDLLTKGIDENGNIRNEKTHRFKDSPVGRIPEEWEVVRLGEVAFITSSKRIYYNEYLTEGVPFFRSKEIIELSDGSFAGATLYISHDKFKYIANKFGVPEAGDILITAVGTLGIVYLVKQEDLPFYFKDGNLLWIKLGENLNKLYFVKSFSQWFNIQKDNLTIGTSQSALTIEKLKEMLIPLPPLPEQQKIAEILSQIDQTIEKEQQYKEKLQRIKQGLMQDLLTGKVRVNHLVEEKEDEQRYTSNFTRT
jgi:type I restriction enzyme S subunit